jgi:hypothetical protein
MAAWAEEAGVGGEGPNDPMKLVIQAALLRKVIVRALILAFPAITLDLVQELGSALEFSQGPLIAEKMTQVILYSLPRFALLRMLIGNWTVTESCMFISYIWIEDDGLLKHRTMWRGSGKGWSPFYMWIIDATGVKDESCFLSALPHV